MGLCMGGYVGNFLSVPLTAIIKIIMSNSESKDMQFLSDLMSKDLINSIYNFAFSPSFNIRNFISSILVSAKILSNNPLSNFSKSFSNGVMHNPP